MTIRTRMTWWYAIILFASTFLITILTSHELAVEPGKTADHAKEEELEQTQVVGAVLWCGIPAAILGLLGGWWLMRKAMAPVTALTRAAAAIHDRNLGQTIPRSDNGDELDQLTQVFNDMTQRLDRSFSQIREFTLNASHELKTPLTIMRAEIETAIRNNTSLERERLLSYLDEIQRLAKIVDGLTLLTKADAGLVDLQHAPLRFDELVRESYADAKVLAQAQQIGVELTQCDPVTIQGDRHRLRQLLLNLNDNAIKYNRPNGRVRLALRAVNHHAELQISNTGPGLAPEVRDRVFDRFFRGDSSHNNTIDGCGLGLSIAQWIVTAHKGKIVFQSEPGKETTVTVELPTSN